MKKKLFLSCLILMISLFTSATNYQVSSLAALEAQENGLSPGDSVFLLPGDYFEGITLDKKHASEVVFVIHSSTFTSSDRFTFDLKGENITLLLKDSKLTGGREATIGVRGDFCKVISDKSALLTDAATGLLLLGTNNHIEGLIFKGQTVAGISGNNLKLDPETRNFQQGFNWGPSNNWRITFCEFYDIAPRDPGNAGGGIRLIPHVKDVLVDNCLFQNINGNALWFDHYMDGIRLFYNTFINIEYKCIFLEISDPDPDNPSIYGGAQVAGNISRGNQRHGVLVASSSNVKIWGNDLEGWPIVIGALRKFYRRFDVNDKSTWEQIQGELRNNHVYNNLLKPTKGRNHIMIQTGLYTSGTKIEGNYYVTGFTSEFNSTLIDDARFMLNEGKFLHSTDVYGITEVDKSGKIGNTPISFPYQDSWQKIPVERRNGPVIVIPNPPDSTDKDSNVTTPSPSIDRPAVWIISDLSSGRTDPDDRVSAAMVLVALDKVDLKGFTIGAHKWDLSGVLEGWFNPNIGNAYAQEVAALNAEYGGFPDVLPMHESITTGKGFKEGSITELTGSLQAMYEAAQQVVKQGKKFYVLLWGPQNEAAYFADYAMRQTDQRVFLNTVFISHASSPSELNNCSKDAEACAFLHNLAAQGKIKYYEMGFSGKVIDNGTFPKIGTEVLKSKIGSFLQEKWKVEKPDGSDAFIYYAAFVPEVGGGLDYLSTLKSDGTSNEAKLMNDFSKPPIYAFLQTRYAVASSGKTGSPDVGNGGNQISLKQELQTIIDALLRIVNGL